LIGWNNFWRKKMTKADSAGHKKTSGPTSASRKKSKTTSAPHKKTSKTNNTPRSNDSSKHNPSCDTKTRLQSILSELNKRFHFNSSNSSIRLAHQKWPQNITSPFFVVSNDGQVEVAFIPQLISEETAEEITHNLEYLQEQENVKKVTYCGVLDNSMPMNYITAKTDSRIGDYIANYLNPTLNPIVQNILNALSFRTLNYLVSLNEELMKINNSSYPVTAINFLTPDLDDHRILKAHKDHQDSAPSILMYFGDYPKDEGYLEFTEKNCKIHVRPGDILLFKGNKYKHAVAKISTGHRIGMVYFVHKGNKTKPFYNNTQKKSLLIHKEII